MQHRASIGGGGGGKANEIEFELTFHNGGGGGGGATTSKNSPAATTSTAKPSSPSSSSLHMSTSPPRRLSITFARPPLPSASPPSAHSNNSNSNSNSNAHDSSPSSAQPKASTAFARRHSFAMPSASKSTSSYRRSIALPPPPGRLGKMSRIDERASAVAAAARKLHDSQQQAFPKIAVMRRASTELKLGSVLSPAGQCAVIKFYEDELYNRLRCRCAADRSLPRMSTAVYNAKLTADENNNSNNRRRLVNDSVVGNDEATSLQYEISEQLERAMQMLDTLSDGSLGGGGGSERSVDEIARLIDEYEEWQLNWTRLLDSMCC